VAPNGFANMVITVKKDIKMLKNFVLMAGAVVVLSGCSACSNVEDEPVGASATNLPTVHDGDYADTMIVDTNRDMKMAANYKMVNFGYDSSTLSSTARKNLNMFADHAKKAGIKSVVVEGHCDERGTKGYNIALGESRAKSVASFLKVNGVSDAQIEVISYGEERPAEMGQNEAAWSKNRRVYIEYK